MFSFYKGPETFQCYFAFRINISLCFSCLSQSFCCLCLSGCGCGDQRPVSFPVASSLYFFETESLSKSRVHLCDQIASKPKRASCFCLLSVGITGVNMTDQLVYCVYWESASYIQRFSFSQFKISLLGTIFIPLISI